MIIGRMLPTGPYSIYLEWSIRDIELLTMDTVEIYRSSGEAGPYDLKVSLDTGPAAYLDEGMNNVSYQRVFYYIIKLVRDDEVIDQSPKLCIEHTDGQQDLLYGMIQRASSIGYRRLFGSKLYVLQKRDWGVPCECRDMIRGHSSEDDCRACYGTSFHGGFYTPVITRGKRSPFVKKSIMQYFVTEPGDEMIKLMNYPVVKVGDTLVDSMNHRYEIINIRVNRRLDLMVSQLLQVRRYPSISDLIYMYDLDIPALKPEIYRTHVPL